MKNTQGYNRYSYVQNNPLNATDPTGYWLTLVVGVIAKLAGWNAVITGFVVGYVAVAQALYYGAGANAFGIGIIAGVTAGIAGGAFGKLTVAKFFIAASLGGLQSKLSGGKFSHGFIAAGMGFFNPFDDWGGLIASSVIGGTVSEMTGGKFKNGAKSAAFSYVVMWGAGKIGARKDTYVETNYETEDESEVQGYEYVPEADRQAYLEKSLSEFKEWVKNSNIPLDNRTRAEALTVTYDPEFVDAQAQIEYQGKDFGKITVGPKWFTNRKSAGLELNAEDRKYVRALDWKGFDRFRWTHELAHLDPDAIKSVQDYRGPPYKAIPWAKRSWEQSASTTAVRWMRGN